MQDGSVSPIRNFFRNKWVRLILIIDVSVIIAIIVFSINKAAKTAVVSFNVTPVDATITINGNGNYQNGGEAYFLTPGTYDVQISHSDLNTKTFTIDLADDSNTTITTFLSKDGDFYFYTLRDNFSSFNRLASIASAEDNQTTDNDTSAEIFIANFQEQYNLYQTELPINYTERIPSSERGITVAYDLTIRRASDKSSCIKYLCIEAFMTLTDDKNLVNSMLEDIGFNLEDFEIEYKIY